LKSSFLIGSIIAIVAHLIGFLLNDYNITLKVTGFVVIGSFVIAGILNGTFISGDRYRANALIERKEERDKKMKITGYLLSISIPNVIISIIILLFNS
jgi:accessory gene regulator protein AgrB